MVSVILWTFNSFIVENKYGSWLYLIHTSCKIGHGNKQFHFLLKQLFQFFLTSKKIENFIVPVFAFANTVLQ